MWIPYTDEVVVVMCNPQQALSDADIIVQKNQFTDDEKLKPFRDLLQSLNPSKPDINNLSFSELRDELLALNPLDQHHVISVNKAESKYWCQNAGLRLAESDRILNFECGGEQWVCEVALPCGSLENLNFRDLDYMEEVLELIEKHKIPAPAPIEQRWTARSSAFLSPAFSDDPNALFSWVGIIMYLPLHDELQRAAITKKFEDYMTICRENLWDKYFCKVHWAKLELPKGEEDSRKFVASLRSRYPLDAFVHLRKKVDPRGILGNEFIETIFPLESKKEN